MSSSSSSSSFLAAAKSEYTSVTTTTTTAAATNVTYQASPDHLMRIMIFSAFSWSYEKFRRAGKKPNIDDAIQRTPDITVATYDFRKRFGVVIDIKANVGRDSDILPAGKSTGSSGETIQHYRVPNLVVGATFQPILESDSNHRYLFNFEPDIVFGSTVYYEKGRNMAGISVDGLRLVSGSTLLLTVDYNGVLTIPIPKPNIRWGFLDDHSSATSSKIYDTGKMYQSTSLPSNRTELVVHTDGTNILLPVNALDDLNVWKMNQTLLRPVLICDERDDPIKMVIPVQGCTMDFISRKPFLATIQTTDISRDSVPVTQRLEKVYNLDTLAYAVVIPFGVLAPAHKIHLFRGPKHTLHFLPRAHLVLVNRVLSAYGIQGRIDLERLEETQIDGRTLPADNALGATGIQRLGVRTGDRVFQPLAASEEGFQCVVAFRRLVSNIAEPEPGVGTEDEFGDSRAAFFNAVARKYQSETQDPDRAQQDRIALASRVPRELYERLRFDNPRFKPIGCQNARCTRSEQTLMLCDRCRRATFCSSECHAGGARCCVRGEDGRRRAQPLR